MFVEQRKIEVAKEIKAKTDVLYHLLNNEFKRAKDCTQWQVEDQQNIYQNIANK